MKKYSYTVIYEEDADGGVVASVPALPGCYSQGNTPEEAEKHITEAIELYLESLHEEQQDAPKEHIWQGRVAVAA